MKDPTLWCGMPRHANWHSHTAGPAGVVDRSFGGDGVGWFPSASPAGTGGRGRGPPGGALQGNGSVGWGGVRGVVVAGVPSHAPSGSTSGWEGTVTSRERAIPGGVMGQECEAYTADHKEDSTKYLRNYFPFFLGFCRFLPHEITSNVL